MITITEGVEFDTIAREWRLKWSPDDDKKSLAAVQQTLTESLSSLKAISGVKSVQRIVCGGCLDYKVIIALSAEKFGEWVCLYAFYVIMKYIIYIDCVYILHSYIFSIGSQTIRS